jgi:hypothetical protein
MLEREARRAVAAGSGLRSAGAAPAAAGRRCRAAGRRRRAAGSAARPPCGCRPARGRRGGRRAPGDGAAASPCSGAAARPPRRSRRRGWAQGLARPRIRCKGGQHLGRVEAAGAGVDAGGERAFALLHEGIEDGERRVVHRLEAEILQHPEDGGLAGARQARDEHEGPRGPENASLSRSRREGSAGERVSPSARPWRRPARPARRRRRRSSPATAGRRPGLPIAAVREGARPAHAGRDGRPGGGGRIAIGRPSTRPSPKTSIRPASSGGGEACRRPSTAFRTNWSSATRSQPRPSRRRSRSDLPPPGGARINTASPSRAAQLACRSIPAARMFQQVTLWQDWGRHERPWGYREYACQSIDLIHRRRRPPYRRGRPPDAAAGDARMGRAEAGDAATRRQLQAARRLQPDAHRRNRAPGRRG